MLCLVLSGVSTVPLSAADDRVFLVWELVLVYTSQYPLFSIIYTILNSKNILLVREWSPMEGSVNNILVIVLVISARVHI